MNKTWKENNLLKEALENNKSLFDKNCPVRVTRYTSNPSGFSGSLPQKIISSYDKALNLIKKQYDELRRSGQGNFEEIDIKDDLAWGKQPCTHITFDAGYESWEYRIFPITKKEYEDYLDSLDNL